MFLTREHVCLQLPSAEDVEFWNNPEKAGWLQSQGEHIKTWRRRWFVLKQGYLFRFAGPDVTSSSKARGLVDLSKVTDVSAARDATGRNNSLMLSTPTGRVLYVADSETEQVEWLSALEGTVAKIVKQVPPQLQPIRPMPVYPILASLDFPASAHGSDLHDGEKHAAVQLWHNMMSCNMCAGCWGRG